MIMKVLLVGLTAVATAVPAVAGTASVTSSPTTSAPVSTTAPPLAPAKGEVAVEVVTANGSGCPVGTTAVAVSADNLAVLLYYSAYLAVADPDQATTAQRRSCQVLLRLDYPWDEYTAAVSRVRYTGYAEIAEGATGEVRAQDFLAGTSRPPDTVLAIPGPVSDWWQLTDSRDQDRQVWLPCGEQRNLNVVSALRIMPGTSDAGATSYLSLDEPVRIDLAWQRC